ncbi:MAG: hypothetical protein JJE35_10895 [Thermoleophilia bacterium]|nr:hypothetical protein [Thermoleophilia bacterium]
MKGIAAVLDVSMSELARTAEKFTRLPSDGREPQAFRTRVQARPQRSEKTLETLKGSPPPPYPPLPPPS